MPESDPVDELVMLRDTGNEATEPDEENILAELYGPADADGVYRGGEDA